MTGFKRLIAVMAALAALAIGVFAFSGAASAYTPSGGTSALTISTTTPCAGCSVTISGSGFASGEKIGITEHSKVETLGSAVALSSGSFSATVTTASDLTGTHEIVALGASSGHRAVVTIDVPEASGTGTSSGSGSGSSSGGGLASTGVAVIGIGAVGVVLLAGGGVMLMAGRRRSSANV